MTNVKIANRYAKSFFDFSVEKNVLVSSIQETNELMELIAENTELRTFFNNPMQDVVTKINLIKELFKNFSNETQNFLLLLASQGRLNILEEVLHQIIHLNNQHSGNHIVQLTLAKDVSDSQIQEIVEKGKVLLNFTGNNIEVRKKIDASIIGGFIIQIKDKQLDASLKNRLADLKNHFNLSLYKSHL